MSEQISSAPPQTAKSQKSNWGWYGDDPYLGEIRIVSFTFAPKGWFFCDGRLLPINQYQALFSLLGTMYGGNGITTFALPNLCGRFPCHTQHEGIYNQDTGGTESTMLTLPTKSIVPAETGTAVNALSTAGSPITISNLPPYLALNFIIAAAGVYPCRD